MGKIAPISTTGAKDICNKLDQITSIVNSIRETAAHLHTLSEGLHRTVGQFKTAWTAPQAACRHALEHALEGAWILASRAHAPFPVPNTSRNIHFGYTMVTYGFHQAHHARLSPPSPMYAVACVGGSCFLCKNTHLDKRLASMNSGKLIRTLEDDGWEQVRVTGSHHHFKHPTKPGLVTVPHPKKDLPIGTVSSILKQAGLK